MTNLDRIDLFLKDYKNVSDRLSRHKAEHYKSKFHGLLSGYTSIRNVVSELDRIYTPQYNIFEILNIKRAEVKTHTPFLTNLLNPKGSHKQGTLFLNTFMQLIPKADKRVNFILKNENDYHVTQEKRTTFGQIDILIQSSDPKNRFGLIIENKIGSQDQSRQIERYYKYLSSLKYTDQRMMIFYLTVNGSDPSSLSISRTMCQNLKERGILANISYNSEIKSWLKDSLDTIKSQHVKSLIEQYLQVIKEL